MTLRRSIQDTLARETGPPTLLVVSNGPLGATLASEFDSDADVRLVTDHDGVAGRAPDDTRVTVGDVTSHETLCAGEGVDVAVVALGTDRETMLVTQLLRTRFGVENVVVLLNDPQRHDALADVATTVVCGTNVLTDDLRRAITATAPMHESVGS